MTFSHTKSASWPYKTAIIGQPVFEVPCAFCSCFVPFTV